MADRELNLNIKQVIGNGKPTEETMVGPLRQKWDVPPWCVFCIFNNKGDLSKSYYKITRFLVLAGPVKEFFAAFLGKRVVGCCEPHFKERVWNQKTDPEFDESPIIGGADVAPRSDGEQRA